MNDQATPPTGEPLVPIEDRLVHPVGERAAVSPKERMTILRQLMPEQDADARAHNFAEVNLGLPERVAMLEAERCLQCKNRTEPRNRVGRVPTLPVSDSRPRLIA